METTTNTNTNQPMQLKRSAAQVHTAALRSGWELVSATEDSNIQTLCYKRDDEEAQREAYAIQGVRLHPTCKLKAQFDPEQGSYYGVRFANANDEFVGWHSETVSEAVANIERPQREIRRVAERHIAEVLQDEKDAKREAFVEAFRSAVSDDSGYGWSVRRMQQIADAEVEAAEMDTNDPVRYLRNASQTAKNMIRKSLATEALKRFGQPQEYANGEFSDGTTLQQALTDTIQEAFRNYSNRDVLPQLQEAASELDRGY